MGGLRIGRFVAVTLPCTIACLAVVAGIVVGWISVAFASSKPLDLSTTRGAADRMSIAMGGDSGVTGIAMDEQDRPVAVVRVQDAEMDDLCLVPRLNLPVVGKLISLKLTTGRTVRMNSVDLAAGATTLDGLRVPQTTIGAAAGTDGVRGHAGGFGVVSEGAPGAIVMDRLAMQAYGLRLNDGISLRSLALRAELGDQDC